MPNLLYSIVAFLFIYFYEILFLCSCSSIKKVLWMRCMQVLLNQFGIKCTHKYIKCSTYQCKNGFILKCWLVSRHPSCQCNIQNKKEQILTKVQFYNYSFHIHIRNCVENGLWPTRKTSLNINTVCFQDI